MGCPGGVVVKGVGHLMLAVGASPWVQTVWVRTLPKIVDCLHLDFFNLKSWACASAGGQIVPEGTVNPVEPCARRALVS